MPASGRQAACAQGRTGIRAWIAALLGAARTSRTRRRSRFSSGLKLGHFIGSDAIGDVNGWTSQGSVDAASAPPQLHAANGEVERPLAPRRARGGHPDRTAADRITQWSSTYKDLGSGPWLPILAAITDRGLVALLIDEPEVSLEPRLQKALRDLLVEATNDIRSIVVATHSHLFINRQVVESTQIVGRTEGRTTVETVSSREELYDLTFDMLGSSTEDLFFPRNYIVVEGASDQAIVEKVLELLDVPSPTIKVLSARGLDAVRDAIESVVRALVPLVVRDSPYSKRVIAMIDEPSSLDHPNLVKLRRDLDDRLYELDKHSVEEYIPAEIYERAERSKDEDLGRIEELRGKLRRERGSEAEISTTLAAALTEDDLDSISIISDACQRAIDESAP